MNPQVNWQKLKGELNKLTDVAKLRQDLQKIATEIRNFDFHTVLTPQAQERVKKFEKKYADLISTVHQAQRQVDREVNKMIRQVKGHRLLASVKLDGIRRVANDQRDRLTKVTADLRKRMSKDTDKYMGKDNDRNGTNGKKRSSGKKASGARKSKSAAN